MLKKIVRQFAISLAILIGGAVVGYLLIVLSFLIKIPTEKYDTVMSILNEEGFHPRDYVRDGRTDYYFERFPDILDIATDQIILSHSMASPEEGILKAGVFPDYFRYWHGYVVFWRPLLKVLNLDELRIFNFMIQLALALVLAWLLIKVTGKKRFALVWLSVYAIMIPNTLALNLQYSSSYYVAVISAIVLLKYRGFFSKNHRFLYLFMTTGMLTVYFDFLTYPLLTWGLSACIMLATFPTDEAMPYKRRCLTMVIDVVLSAALWAIGYVVFWAEKWFITYIITGENAFQNGLIQIRLRSGAGAYGITDRLSSFSRNSIYLSYLPFLIVFILWFFFWMFNLLKKGLILKSEVAGLFIVAFSSLVWYFVAAQHTGTHPHLAWRNNMVTVLAGLFIICTMTDHSTDNNYILLFDKMRQKIALLAVCAVLSVTIYALVPVETVTVQNYEVANTEIQLPAGEKEAISIKLTPRYGFVKEVDPLLECENLEGVYRFILREGEKEIFSEDVKVSEAYGNRIYDKVYWHLKRGHTYDFVISTEKVNAPVKLWVTSEPSLSEYEGNTETIAMGIVYFTHFINKTDTVFYLLSWFSLFMVLICLGLTLRYKEG